MVAAKGRRLMYTGAISDLRGVGEPRATVHTVARQGPRRSFASCWLCRWKGVIHTGKGQVARARAAAKLHACRSPVGMYHPEYLDTLTEQVLNPR
jgi:hypothetical protein